MPQKSEFFPDTVNDAKYDVVRGMAEALEKGAGSEVYHLAREINLPTNTIIAGQLVFDLMAEFHGFKLVQIPNLVE